MFLNSFSIKGVEKEVLCSLYSVDGLPRSNEMYWKLKHCANSFGKYLRIYSTDYFYEGKPCVLLLGDYKRHDPFYVDKVYEIRYLKKSVLDLSNKSDQEAFREFLYQGIRKELEHEHRFWGRYNTYYKLDPAVVKDGYELYQGFVFRIDFYNGFMLTLDPTTKTLETKTLKKKINEMGAEHLTSELTGHKLVECFPDTKRECRFHAVSTKKASEKSFLYKDNPISVIEYYRDVRRRPDIAELIDPTENVILIKYYDKQREPYHHAPSLLKSTVLTDKIPKTIKKDYIFLDPEKRWDLTKKLLEYLTPIKLGDYEMTIDFYDGLERNFQSDVITMPTLEFGNSTFLEPTDENLRNWDFKKKNFLHGDGPYSKPRYLDKFVLFRSHIVPEENAKQFYRDIQKAFSKYLKFSLPQGIKIQSYEDRNEMEDWLGNYGKQLSGALALHHKGDTSYFYLKKVLKDIPLQCFQVTSFEMKRENEKRYDNMIFVTAVGFGAKMGFRPWVLKTQLSADCYIGLDVGGDRTHVMGNCYIINKKGTYLELGKAIPQRGESISEDIMTEVVSDAIFDSIKNIKMKWGRLNLLLFIEMVKLQRLRRTG